MQYFLFLVFSIFFIANAEAYELKSMNFITENDADFRSDEAYSYGSGVSFLFLRDDVNDSSDRYISFAYAHKLYTPQDIQSTQLVVDDRPYAGYQYLQLGFHNSSNNSLNSLTLQLGIVGPSTKMHDVQKFVHSLIGSPYPQGWDNQLSDEIILQLNYEHNDYIATPKLFNLNADVLTKYGFELGNESTKAFGGVNYRLGSKIAQDYNAREINNLNTNTIPLSAAKQYLKEWNYSLMIGSQLNLVAHNIFLDGNSFKESHSVEKNIFVLDITYGINITYHRFSFDYLRKHSSWEFKTQTTTKSYGSFVFTYNY